MIVKWEGKLFMPTISSITYRNNTFRFGAHGNGLNRFVLAVVSDYVLNHPMITYSELKLAFPDTLQNNREIRRGARPRLGVFAKLEFAEEVSGRDRERYFHIYPIMLSDGTRIVVCTNWGQLTKTGVENLLTFIAHAKKIGFKFEVRNQRKATGELSAISRGVGSSLIA